MVKITPGFRSLLYSEPRLYDLVFPDAEEAIGRMCREAFRRYLPAAPRSLLDIGCGTGRHLEALAKTVTECWGMDLLASNIAYARSAPPHLHFAQGDMRTIRSAACSTSSRASATCSPMRSRARTAPPFAANRLCARRS